MSKEKKSFNIMDKLHNAGDSAVGAVKDISLSEAKEKIQDTADSAKDALKKVKLSDVDV